MDEEAAHITVNLRKVEKYVRTLPIMRKLTTLSRDERDSLLDMQGHLEDARKLAHDSATSELVEVKVASLRRCVEELELFRQALLKASQYDLVDTVDVAHLSAIADQAGDHATVHARRLG